MTPLRLRMIEDMRTAGLASGTQALYLDAVRNLAAHYHCSPDQLSEEELVFAVARGTVQTLGDHAAWAKAGSALAIRSNRCPNPAPSVPL
jgi:hypothetical protein